MIINNNKKYKKASSYVEAFCNPENAIDWFLKIMTVKAICDKQIDKEDVEILEMLKQDCIERVLVKNENVKQRRM